MEAKFSKNNYKRSRYVFKKYATINNFLDFDFYVPKDDRKGSGLKANPFKEGHFLIGGTILRTYPMINNFLPEKKNFWIWNYDMNEKLLLKSIYEYFIECWELLQKNNSLNDLTICGLGISRLDLPYLFARCIFHKIDNEINLFNIFQKVRIFDLENVTIPHFNTIDNYIYNKQKNEIYNLFLNSKPNPSTKIWAEYDDNKYRIIQKNNEDNVDELINIYKILLRCGIIKRMRKVYKKDTFENIFQYIDNENNRKTIEDNFLYNETEAQWCLNEYILDMNNQRNFLRNIETEDIPIFCSLIRNHFTITTSIEGLETSTVQRNIDTIYNYLLAIRKTKNSHIKMSQKRGLIGLIEKYNPCDEPLDGIKKMKRWFYNNIISGCKCIPE